MSKIHIVLVEPEIPQNTGNIARTCAATGASLHLVKPMGFTPDAAKLKRAGLDYWDKLDITYYENLAEFLEKHQNDTLYCFTSKATHTYTDIHYPEETYLVFGKETEGLPEWLTAAHEETSLRIPMREGLRCLNLSNAAAIAVYEVLRQQDFAALSSDGSARRKTNW